MEKAIPDRLARHYADMAALSTHPIARKAIDRSDVCERVVNWKDRFFGSAWANFDKAKAGTFRLVPPPSRLAALRHDYQAMRDMFLTTPPDFVDVLAALAALENHINKLGTVKQ